MTLESPFPIYGTVTCSASGNPIQGANIEVSASIDSKSTTTGKKGYYYINIQNIAADGDTVNIDCNINQSSKSSSFTLNVSDYSHREDYSFDAIFGKGDLVMYYGNRTDAERVFGGCSTWKKENDELTVETILSEGEFKAIKNNIRPGAVEEVELPTMRNMYFDSTWEGKNTILIKPSTNSYLSTVKDGKICYPKSVSTHIIGKDMIGIKLTSKISGSVS